MNILSAEQLQMISGGVSDAEADQSIGNLAGTIWHGMNSTEAKIGALFGPLGYVSGAVIHFKRHH